MSRRNVFARRCKGSAIAEFAPALFILFVVILFPALDMLLMGITFMEGQWLHNQMLHQAAVSAIAFIPPSPTAVSGKKFDLSCCDGSNTAKEMLKPLVDNWKNSGLGQFASLSSDPQWTVTGDDTGAGITQFVNVSLNLHCKPPFPIPFVGIGNAVPFSYSGKARIENVQNY